MADFHVTIIHRPEMVPKTIEKYFDRTVRITDFEFYVIASLREAVSSSNRRLLQAKEHRLRNDIQHGAL